MPTASQRASRSVGQWMAIVTVLLTLLWPGSSGAQQPSELARARATFQQAVELEHAGNCSAALPLFREVGQVRMTPQVRFHIAVCEGQLGRLVAALGGFELALADADSVGPGFRDEVEQHIGELRGRIPKLEIQRGAGAEAAAIELDAVALGSTSIGVEVPLDPGPHSITARAPGYSNFEQTITLFEGESKIVEVSLVPLPRVAQAELPPAAASPPVARPVPIVPYVIGGVGAASLVGSGVLFALRQSTADGLEDECQNGVCPRSQRGEYDRLKTYHYASFVTLGVGVGAIGVAAALIVLDRPASRKEEARISIQPTLLPRAFGGTLRLRF